MVIVLDKPKITNEKLEIKLNYKCKNCGCNVYKTNIGELMEEAIQNKIKEYKPAEIVYKLEPQLELPDIKQMWKDKNKEKNWKPTRY